MPDSTERRAARHSSRAEVAFKRELVASRENAGLSQRRLAELMGVDPAAVRRIERLDSDPNLSTLRQYLTHCWASMELRVISQTTPTTDCRR
ncbi:helix-turn-helix domain-containing protein [Mycobacterium koreense]|uniref:helix-turn-helix domain-containing protein n=1 Tax=Mycolicibacillus koreensis TaxID=1069220 RepID=UPI00138C29F8|nr:helix-turn-helix domain-containing protein [Mycolicibacillus koreensis]MCV7247666.1 helix-turn-helix domain-containing protein [Mycolicibacillus koreensis]BBY54051.1 hypothetical protein MKOR_13020 [Mycolicibacillus koreensis]